MTAHADVERTSMANRLLYLARHGESEATQAANPENGELTEIGRQQSELLGKRLQGIPFAAIHHSPWTRAAQTAAIVAEHLPGIPLLSSDLLQECIPAVPDRQRLTPSQAEFFDHLPKQRVAAGPAQAAAAIQAYTGLVTEDRRDLIISHGNLINWFVAQALEAPDQAWLNMLDYSCALTVIMYFPDRTRLISYNDMGHLPPSMRGTDYPLEARS
jgi:serine/threonine-protein phosphatase PGAM5